MKTDIFQYEAARRRYRERTNIRERNTRLIKEGYVLKADEPARVERFLTRRGFSESAIASLLSKTSKGVPSSSEMVSGQYEPDALERMLGTNDLVGVAFLERGLRVARSVGRVILGVAGGGCEGYGTGFLISPRLLLTNHHVLGDKALAGRSLVEFDYQTDADGRQLPTVTFGLEPGVFHFADQHLDYAVVAVSTVSANGRQLREFGSSPLIETQGKTIVGQWMNIVQHPNGEIKQLGLRENQLTDLLDDFLHYQTDTAPGSSGSPVYNDLWEVVALHHSGVWATNPAGQILAVDGSVWREEMGEHRIKWIANEGVRISRIVAHLRTQEMNLEQRQLFEKAITFAQEGPEEKDIYHDNRTPVRAVSSEGVMHPDGTATWTIPLTVSVRLGGAPLAGITPVTGVPPAPPAPPSEPPDGGSGDENSVLAAARKEFGKRSDVVSVQLGYVFKGGWITGDRALVVAVRKRLPISALKTQGVSPLPRTFGGLPVEVTSPSVKELIRLARGPAAAEVAIPEAYDLRQEIKYFPPNGMKLKEFRAEPMEVIAHVSPDAGWSQLSAFLQATRKQLVVGMYDFGAPHIVDAIDAATASKDFRKFTLVMQHGESVGKGTKADDMTDDEVVEHFSQGLKKKFESAWVRKGAVNGWISSSYHIKVAVRDSKALWLSSGNWQSSNQPETSPADDASPGPKWLRNYNREWHAIITHEELAKTFEAYLLHDFEQNRDFVPKTKEELALPDLFVPEFILIPAEEKIAKAKYFGPKTIKRKVTVQPLLTPDNYLDIVLGLVESAQEELLIQNQTFLTPKESHDSLRRLIDAVLEKQQAGVKVRVIFRLLMPRDARDNLTALKDYGFDMKDIKVQKCCHTKGVIVDRKRVLIGSQNWSNDGVSVNRDASLLFDDKELAQYFATIFDYDWDSLAQTDIGSEAAAIELAATSAPTPQGTTRLNWKDYVETL